MRKRLGKLVLALAMMAVAWAAQGQRLSAYALTVDTTVFNTIVSTGTAMSFTNIDDGYVMTQYTKDTSKKLKVQVKGPFRTYTFNLSPMQWETFPLADGNGIYHSFVYDLNPADLPALIAAADEKWIPIYDHYANNPI